MEWPIPFLTSSVAARPEADGPVQLSSARRACWCCGWCAVLEPMLRVDADMTVPVNIHQLEADELGQHNAVAPRYPNGRTGLEADEPGWFNTTVLSLDTRRLTIPLAGS